MVYLCYFLIQGNKTTQGQRKVEHGNEQRDTFTSGLTIQTLTPKKKNLVLFFLAKTET